jgi:2-polyprenyl-3-methyl-5-hydroxy-6-metoxy-1,4-benzoquinol methylase
MQDNSSKRVSENTEWILRAIHTVSAKSPVETSCPWVPGTTKDLVQRIQRLLNELGAQPMLAEDGVMGERTLRAILTALKPATGVAFAKSVLWLSYRLVRSIVRPVAWRFRAFLLEPVLPPLSLIRRQFADHANTMSALQKSIWFLKENLDEKTREIAGQQYQLCTSAERKISELAAALDDTSKEIARFSDIEKQAVLLSRTTKDIEQSLTTLCRNFEQMVARMRDIDNKSTELQHTIRSATFDHSGGDFGNLYADLQDHFRGSRRSIKNRLRVYLKYLSAQEQTLSAKPVIDLGCGRGEWLDLLTENNISCVGIDINERFIAENEGRGMTVVKSDAVEYLAKQPDESARAISSFHLIEHLPFATFVEMIDQSRRVLASDGFVVFETPNPENLITATHNFYLDPTHRKPIPPIAADFLLRKRGFKTVEILRLHENANDARTSIQNDFLRNLLFGPQDFAIIGHK